MLDLSLRDNIRIEVDGTIHFRKNDVFTVYATFNPATGAISAVDHINTSDSRLKDDITDFVIPLESITSINPKIWSWKESGKPSAGAIAQDVQAILPVLVSEGEDGMLSVSDAKVALVLVLSLAKEVESLKAQLKSALEG